MDILGIDIGGSGMKGALVNIETGELITERFRIPTPASQKPKEMAKVFKDIVAHVDYKGPVGCGFPTIMNHGVCKSVGNLNKSWLNLNAQNLFSEACGLPVTIVNDADAAGYAVRLVKSIERSRPLCPDHRDKQKGKPCLACTIERLERENLALKREAGYFSYLLWNAVRDKSPEDRDRVLHYLGDMVGIELYKSARGD